MGIRVIVADESVVFRNLLSEVLNSFPEVEVVAKVSNVKKMVEKIKKLHPDLLTIDLEMQGMDGLTELDALKVTNELPTVIVVSAPTKKTGDLAIQALQKGAFDIICKPDVQQLQQGMEFLKRELAVRIKALSLRLNVRNILKGKNNSSKPEFTKNNQVTPTSTKEISERMMRIAGMTQPELVLIGVSTGGPNALASILPSLPANLGVPILIVQHMPTVFTRTLADSLKSKCALDVREATHEELICKNTVYIAPGGKQMRLVKNNEGMRMIQLTDDPMENNCRPAVDYLFRSVANHFPKSAMAVILTGMGSDGTIGLKLLKQHGCFVIAQDECSCVVNGMPKSAIDAGVVDIVLPLSDIADQIIKIVKGG